MDADESLANVNEPIYYAASTDNRTTWKIVNGVDGEERSIVRNNVGTWQYNSNTTYGSETWTNAGVNEEISALEQAINLRVANRMDRTQLLNVSVSSYYTLGNEFDLMIALQPTTIPTKPSSLGVDIRYDATAIQMGAVLGEDYIADQPNTSIVRVESAAAQNLKIKIS